MTTAPDPAASANTSCSPAIKRAKSTGKLHDSHHARRLPRRRPDHRRHAVRFRTLQAVLQVGGTSLSSPIDGGNHRDRQPGPRLESTAIAQQFVPTQTLSLLYTAPQDSIFHDITTGDQQRYRDSGDNFENGFAAAPGYDIATGLGSPIGNNLINYLGGNNTSAPPTVSAPIDVTVDENESYIFNTISVSDRIVEREPRGHSDRRRGHTCGPIDHGVTITGNDSSSVTVCRDSGQLEFALSS